MKMPQNRNCGVSRATLTLLPGLSIKRLFVQKSIRGIMPKRNDLRKILVIGAGPIIIGQGCEFDYSGSQAVQGPSGKKAMKWCW